jgi:hypothetical protein
MEKPLEPATYVGFKSALKQGGVAKAFSVARNLSGLLSLLDALELTLLAAEKGEGWEGTFQDCAARWISRATVEKGLKLKQVVEAVETFSEAPTQGSAESYARLAALL